MIELLPEFWITEVMPALPLIESRLLTKPVAELPLTKLPVLLAAPTALPEPLTLTPTAPRARSLPSWAAGTAVPANAPSTPAGEPAGALLSAARQAPDAPAVASRMETVQAAKRLMSRIPLCTVAFLLQKSVRTADFSTMRTSSRALLVQRARNGWAEPAQPAAIAAHIRGEGDGVALHRG